MKRRILVLTLALALGLLCLSAAPAMAAEVSARLDSGNTAWEGAVESLHYERLFFTVDGEETLVSDDAFTVTCDLGQVEPDGSYYRWITRGCLPGTGTLTITRRADGLSATIPLHTTMPYGDFQIFTRPERSEDCYVGWNGGTVNYKTFGRTYYVLLPDTSYDDYTLVSVDCVDGDGDVITASKYDDKTVRLELGDEITRGGWKVNVELTVKETDGEEGYRSFTFCFSDGKTLTMLDTDEFSSEQQYYEAGGGMYLRLARDRTEEITSDRYDLSVEGDVGTAAWDEGGTGLNWHQGGLPGSRGFLVATDKETGDEYTYRIAVTLPYEAWFTAEEYAVENFAFTKDYQGGIPYGERQYWLLQEEDRNDYYTVTDFTLEGDPAVTAEKTGNDRGLKLVIAPEATGAHRVRLSVTWQQHYKGPDGEVVDFDPYSEDLEVLFDDGTGLQERYSHELSFYVSAGENCYFELATMDNTPVTPEDFDLSVSAGVLQEESDGYLFLDTEGCKPGDVVTLTAVDKETGNAYTFPFYMIRPTFGFFSGPEAANEDFLYNADYNFRERLFPIGTKSVYLVMCDDSSMYVFPEQTITVKGDAGITATRVDERTIRIDQSVSGGFAMAEVTVLRSYGGDSEEEFPVTVCFADGQPMYENQRNYMADSFYSTMDPDIRFHTQFVTCDGEGVTADLFDLRCDTFPVSFSEESSAGGGLGDTVDIDMRDSHAGDRLVIYAIRKSDGKKYISVIDVKLPDIGWFSEPVYDDEHYVISAYYMEYRYGGGNPRTLWLMIDPDYEYELESAAMNYGDEAVTFEETDRGWRLTISDDAVGDHDFRYEYTLRHKYDTDYTHTSREEMNLIEDWDDNAIPYAYAERNADTLTVYASAYSESESAKVLCAVYDAAGCMLDVQMMDIQKSEEHVFTFKDPDTVKDYCRAEIFLTDNNVPLCEQYDVE